MIDIKEKFMLGLSSKAQGVFNNYIDNLPPIEKNIINHCLSKIKTSYKKTSSIEIKDNYIVEDEWILYEWSLPKDSINMNSLLQDVIKNTITIINTTNKEDCVSYMLVDLNKLNIQDGLDNIITSNTTLNPFNLGLKIKITSN